MNQITVVSATGSVETDFHPCPEGVKGTLWGLQKPFQLTLRHLPGTTRGFFVFTNDLSGLSMPMPFIDAGYAMLHKHPSQPFGICTLLLDVFNIPELLKLVEAETKDVDTLLGVSHLIILDFSNHRAPYTRTYSSEAEANADAEARNAMQSFRKAA